VGSHFCIMQSLQLITMRRVSLILSAVVMSAMMLSSCGESASNEITIGNQVWMSENLNVYKFRNGDIIPEAKTDEEWEKAGENGEPAWCYYDNDPANGDKYGKLYNWYAVNDPRGLAPEGWKIPSGEDWGLLNDLFGGEYVGDKMKSTSGWINDGNGTNESGFTGLPGGGRDFNGAFGNVVERGYWWSSSEVGYGADLVWTCQLHNTDGNVHGWPPALKGCGLSVRCLKPTMLSSSVESAYKEVAIGNQVWMSENLNVYKFRNGDIIPEAKTDEEWKKAGENGEPAWCYYYNDSAIGAKYGKLYNWYAVNDPRGLAPVGYHIPSDAEWTALEIHLGADASTKMKSTSGWFDDGNGTNESGFSGLPGGNRTTNGAFGDIGDYGFWWSSTEGSTNDAWFRSLDYLTGNVFRHDFYKVLGFSVRCLRD
jgi:uncharacterized protein (TIGR02145 family)